MVQASNEESIMRGVRKNGRLGEVVWGQERRTNGLMSAACFGKCQPSSGRQKGKSETSGWSQCMNVRYV